MQRRLAIYAPYCVDWPRPPINVLDSYFPMWIEGMRNGKRNSDVWIFTDSDARAYLEKYPDKTCHDLLLPGVIWYVHPEAEGLMWHGLPCHPRVAAAIRRGEMVKLTRLAGYKSLYINEMGQLHRADGPAVTWFTGRQEWWVEGQRHREGGPALVWPGRYKVWYRNGRYVRMTWPEQEIEVNFFDCECKDEQNVANGG